MNTLIVIYLACGIVFFVACTALCGFVAYSIFEEIKSERRRDGK